MSKKGVIFITSFFCFFPEYNFFWMGDSKGKKGKRPVEVLLLLN